MGRRVFQLEEVSVRGQVDVRYEQCLIVALFTTTFFVDFLESAVPIASS